MDFLEVESPFTSDGQYSAVNQGTPHCKKVCTEACTVVRSTKPNNYCSSVGVDRSRVINVHCKVHCRDGVRNVAFDFGASEQQSSHEVDANIEWLKAYMFLATVLNVILRSFSGGSTVPKALTRRAAHAAQHARIGTSSRDCGLC